MAKIKYISKSLRSDKLELIEAANTIIARYQGMGFELTVRQLHYQFVSLGFPNTDKHYDKLQSALNDGRLCGLIDWDAIVDRTRGLRAHPHYAHPRDPIGELGDNFRMWRWEDQPNYVEVWVEKQALEQVVGRVCSEHDVPYFCCRGYTSVTGIHDAAMRFQHEIGHGKTIRVIHLGDHDPSGLDMTRDIKERLNDTFSVPCHIYRVALNKDQIERYNPPPNPAKLTDSRGGKYVDEHWEFSWEVDALPPEVLMRIMTNNINHWKDDAKYQAKVAKESRARGWLRGIYDRWTEVHNLLRETPKED